MDMPRCFLDEFEVVFVVDEVGNRMFVAGINDRIAWITLGSVSCTKFAPPNGLDQRQMRDMGHRCIGAIPEPHLLTMARNRDKPARSTHIHLVCMDDRGLNLKYMGPTMDGALRLLHLFELLPGRWPEVSEHLKQIRASVAAMPRVTPAEA